MTIAALKASLRTWKWRLAYRKRKHAFFHDESKRPDAERKKLAMKWHKLVEEAEYWVARRNREIVSKQRANQKAAAAATGVTKFDGVPVAAWMVPHLQWAREHGWKGRLVSGWRDPVYSESLCYRMCGRPSCPGMCAGRASNHAGSQAPQGAIDVSDYITFGRLMERCPIEPRIHNALPRDLVHFSHRGN